MSKPSTYTGLFGDTIVVDELKKKANPMLRLHGPGPGDVKCKACKHFYRKGYAKIYRKCDLRRNTNGAATDHLASWAACGKFEARK